MTYSGYLSKFTGLVIKVIQYACITHCTLEYVGGFVMCSGSSMEPTIYSDDIVISEHITPRMQSIKKGDIVIAIHPQNPRQYICKRITGVPGDQKLSGFSLKTVPRGHVWLEGDNRSNSYDSRSFGAVPQGLIRGRVVCRIWPTNDFKMLTNNRN
uniref:Peptidase S26 domain-containing protein n=1 Tax=Clastoptera arizonana TaxID=38151 RepID=A0A1B6CTZ4_9HEMI